ncbi:signal transduction histidine kinase [Conyzicola lurida]|uniref:Signal transduction histidine kinase n=1 Tax=Conyzicola lurida TaxID=1172621 RepID=A0A841AMD1_9MICO|nr:ATP-binding protein [Conyzicola lurida]MBB5842579.1 signal transduction histidine kinase [Conyzicola lurida]
MDQILKERDRLLQRTSRIYGLGFTAVAFLCFCVPEAVTPTTYAAAVPLFVVIAFSQYRIGVSRSFAWVAIQTVAALAAVALIAQLNTEPLTAGAVSTIAQLMAASLPSVALVLTSDRLRLIVLAVIYVAVVGVTTAATASSQAPLITAGLLTLGWAIATVVGVWINAGVPQAARRIASIGRAHRAERQASEIEAQRRQGARLLHDTVLATLTLLAHSGVGVAPAALQQQSADDAKLLRQLRLGATPAPQSSGGYNLEPVEETVLGTTLESVKQRFGRMGLEVSWHGTGQVLLPSDVLDAFLLALAECLENVRRHSGVREAHVTIVDDATTVRAMITDAGVGFTLDDVDSARLGFKESVVGRLKEVGGHARLFSEPGSGTTVVLEVPR